MSKECEWNGIKYPTMSAAARELGIEPSSMCNRAKKGYICDTDFLRPPGSSCTINLRYYRNRKEASLALGVSCTVIRRYVILFGEDLLYFPDGKIPGETDRRRRWIGTDQFSVFEYYVEDGIWQYPRKIKPAQPAPESEQS